VFGQTFSPEDIPRVAVLAFLEMLLSADNTIVLGLIASRLHPSLRNRALYIGFVSAWIFRFVGILGIAFLLDFPWLQLAGGLYLLYLAFHHFLKTKRSDPILPTTQSFWKTVLLIEFFDLAFAIDSIVAGVAFIGSSTKEALYHPKLWIVYVGGMIGVFGIRYAAHLFTLVIHRFSRLEPAAYLMIGWIGIKLSLQSFEWRLPFAEAIFWAVLVLLFLFGLTKRRAHV